MKEAIEVIWRYRETHGKAGDGDLPKAVDAALQGEKFELAPRPRNVPF